MRILFVALASIVAMQNDAICQELTPSNCVVPDGIRPDNQIWTSDSWRHFRRGEYREAVASVNACLGEWGPTAQLIQDAMDRDGAPILPDGPVTDEATIRAIHANGLLNDVESNLWILGRSQSILGDLDGARAAYEWCAKLTRALTWDERGWFWRPAPDCSARLGAMDSGHAQP